MRKFGTLSRCCCKASGVGTCNDACTENGNNCAANANGLLFATKTGSENTTDALAACGWAARANQAALVSGQDGNFALLGPVASVGLSKQFYFDYRVHAGVFFEVTSDLGSGSSTNEFKLAALTGIRLSHVASFSSYRVNFGTRFGPTVMQSVVLRIESRLGQVIDSGRDTNGCWERRYVESKVWIDGTLNWTITEPFRFYGFRCRGIYSFEMFKRNSSHPNVTTSSASADMLS